MSDLPLLEFDPEPVAVLDPSAMLRRHRGSIPERAVLCFYAEILAALPDEAVQVGELEAAHGVHPIWRVERNDVEVAVFHPGVGAPLAAAFLEEAIAMGVTAAVACGGCGVISPEIAAGHIVVPTEAVRDEGTSFHYLSASRTVEADPHGVALATALLDERGVAYTAGKVWTTDAIYRETPSKVARRRDEGCLVVEMEAAAFFAVARFRGIRFAQLLYGGDDLTGEVWDAADWTTSPSRRVTFDLAVSGHATLTGLRLRAGRRDRRRPRLRSPPMGIVEDLLANPGLYLGLDTDPDSGESGAARFGVTPLPGGVGVAIDYEVLNPAHPDRIRPHIEHTVVANTHDGPAVMVIAHTHASSVAVLYETEPGVFELGDAPAPFPMKVVVAVPDAGTIRHSWWYAAPGEELSERDVAVLTRV